MYEPLQVTNIDKTNECKFSLTHDSLITLRNDTSKKLYSLRASRKYAPFINRIVYRSNFDKNQTQHHHPDLIRKQIQNQYVTT